MEAGRGRGGDDGFVQFRAVDVVLSLRRWLKWYALILLLAGGAGIGLCFWIKPEYKAAVTLLPHQTKDSRMGRLEAIASKFGIESPVPATNFADFVEPILGSKTFLFRLANFPVPTTDGKHVRLWDSFIYPAESKDLDTLIYLSRMRSMVRLKKSASGVMEIFVTAPTPGAAAGVANETARLINEFNQEYNYSNARANVNYLTEQLANAEGQRLQANEKLVRFLETNRGIDPNTSPALFSRFSNLKMEQEIANQKYLLMRNQFETAQLSLTREEPLLTILDYASTPYFKDAPRRKLIIATHLAAGLALAMLLHAGSALLGPMAARIRKEMRERG